MNRVRRYCGCGNPLAHDNADRFCSACEARRRRDQAPEVPPEFWQAEVMADALASGDLGRMIRAYRSHPFHGYPPLPQTVVAAWLHVSQAALSRIELGRRRLTIDDINWFARSLGMPMALRWVPQQDVSEAREDVDPISRRSLFGAGAGAALGLTATTAPAAAREIDPELVSHWMELMGLLDRHDAMFGPRDVLDTVRRELDLIAGHRRVARGELRTELLRVESRWAEFASWLSYDAGDSLSRDYWGDRALRLARGAGYPDMVAYVLMRRSQWAAMSQDAQRAITLAHAAGRTPGTSGKVRGLCALKEAQGHALAADAASCERSLAIAHELLDGVASAETPGRDLGSRKALPASVLAYEARCWLWLRPQKAVTMLEEALRLWPLDRTRSRGVHQARLALACAAAGEPERAAAEGVRALDIAEATKSDVIVRELGRLYHQLADFDVPVVADFREAFATL